MSFGGKLHILKSLMPRTSQHTLVNPITLPCQAINIPTTASPISSSLLQSILANTNRTAASTGSSNSTNSALSVQSTTTHPAYTINPATAILQPSLPQRGITVSMLSSTTLKRVSLPLRYNTLFTQSQPQQQTKSIQHALHTIMHPQHKHNMILLSPHLLAAFVGCGLDNVDIAFQQYQTEQHDDSTQQTLYWLSPHDHIQHYLSILQQKNVTVDQQEPRAVALIQQPIQVSNQYVRMELLVESESLDLIGPAFSITIKTSNGMQTQLLSDDPILFEELNQIQSWELNDSPSSPFSATPQVLRSIAARILADSLLFPATIHAQLHVTIDLDNINSPSSFSDLMQQTNVLPLLYQLFQQVEVASPFAVHRLHAIPISFDPER